MCLAWLLFLIKCVVRVWLIAVFNLIVFGRIAKTLLQNQGPTRKRGPTKVKMSNSKVRNKVKMGQQSTKQGN